MNQSFPNPKDPGETVTLTFDFTPELTVAGVMEPIVGLPTIAVSVADVAPPDADPNPSLLINGAAQVVGGTVLQSVKVGISGVWYLFVVTATTTTRVLVLRAVLQVMV